MFIAVHNCSFEFGEQEMKISSKGRPLRNAFGKLFFPDLSPERLTINWGLPVVSAAGPECHAYVVVKYKSVFDVKDRHFNSMYNIYTNSVLLA